MMLLVSAVVALPQAVKIPTVLDGIYSPAQAARGKIAFETSCASCHKANLEGFSGPPLKGQLFLDRWREFRADVLYDLIKTSMPKDAAAPLGEAAYLDIFAYLLQANEIPPGSTELKAPVLGRTLLVGKDGPKPLPSSSQVGVVGCLTLEVGTGWFLKGAVEPFRIVDGFEITAAEVEEARRMPLGDLLFRLQDATDLPNIVLRDWENGKVEVKGILVRQANGARINVTALKLARPGCSE